MLHLTEVRYVEARVVWVAFDDGLSGDVDFADVLKGPVFDALDSTEFAKAYLDRESETIAWPNGADLAPEFVHELLLTQKSNLRHG